MYRGQLTKGICGAFEEQQEKVSFSDNGNTRKSNASKTKWNIEEGCERLCDVDLCGSCSQMFVRSFRLLLFHHFASRNGNNRPTHEADPLSSSLQDAGAMLTDITSDNKRQSTNTHHNSIIKSVRFHKP
mmetsp:Transcript_10258/g.28167  ORF Transcript_10258/g.28167 Transcript_10258/m.28167 type:complete len:129 (-) Transcript_10258:304-690(-)